MTVRLSGVNSTDLENSISRCGTISGVRTFNLPVVAMNQRGYSQSGEGRLPAILSHKRMFIGIKSWPWGLFVL